MAKDIKFENSIARKLDSHTDPERFESRPETRRRLKLMIQWIPKLLESLKARPNRDQKTSSLIMAHSYRLHRAKERLEELGE